MIDHLPEIQLLLTGNEIMSGDTIDSNSAVIAHNWERREWASTARSHWETMHS